MRAVRRATGGACVVGVVAALAACAGMEQPPTTTSAGDSADHIFYGLTHYLTTDGVRRAKLVADSAYFYQESQSADLFDVEVTFYAPTGEETSRLTSLRGRYEWLTGDMIARDSVVAVTPDGRRLTTAVLRYDRGRDRIEGPEAFVFVTADGLRREGEAFTADPEFRNVVATRARGELGTVEVER